MRRSEKQCHCEICRKFNADVRHCGQCDICKRKDAYAFIVNWLPELLKEFLGVEEVCLGCRNSVNHYMTEWGLCWANDGDDAIKWALCDYVRTSFFNGHFYPHASAYVKRDCCEYGHAA